MSGGKRASMREGPLAALFRKTEEERPRAGGATRPDARAPGAPPGAGARAAGGCPRRRSASATRSPRTCRTT